jgi:hypothetical protein
MKMNIEKMKEYVRLERELKEEGVFGFHVEGAFQVRDEMLKDEPNLQLQYRDSNEYPYEIYVQHDGIIIYAIITAGQLKDFPQFKEQAKGELKKQLAYLEEDVDLSGMEGDEHATA